MTGVALPIVYLGDSHVRYFRRAAYLGLLAPHEVTGKEVGGATAVGMRNPNSKTNALQQFRRWVQDRPKESIVVVHLGEVDCGFVIWYRANKYGEPVELQLSDSVRAYIDFVDELIAAGFTRVVVTGATLPTITDDDQVGEVVERRSSITATQRQRTDLTVRYNARLQAAATSRGLPYVDITEHVLDPSTGLVAQRMRNSNVEDHHMNADLAGVYWAERLRSAIEFFQPSQAEAGVWKCTHETYLKAYPAHSRNLAADMRAPVRVGQLVGGRELAKLEGGYTLLDQANINDTEYPLLRLLHANHFERVKGGS